MVTVVPAFHVSTAPLRLTSLSATSVPVRVVSATSRRFFATSALFASISACRRENSSSASASASRAAASESPSSARFCASDSDCSFASESASSASFSSPSSRAM